MDVLFELAWHIGRDAPRWLGYALITGGFTAGGYLWGANVIGGRRR